MIAQMILEMVFVLGHELTLGALEQLFGLDVKRALMVPVLLFDYARKDTLTALEYLGFVGHL